MLCNVQKKSTTVGSSHALKEISLTAKISTTLYSIAKK